MGGAEVIFDTVSHGNLQSELISGLRPSGQLIVAEGLDPITVTGHDLAFPRLNISGWYSGVAADSEAASTPSAAASAIGWSSMM